MIGVNPQQSLFTAFVAAIYFGDIKIFTALPNVFLFITAESKNTELSVNGSPYYLYVLFYLSSRKYGIPSP